MTTGRLLVALLVITGLVGSVITGAAFYTRLLVVGLILVAGAWIWISVVARSIRLVRTPDFYRASVGDIFKEQYEISNTSRLPGLWVEVYNEMALPTAAGSRLLTRVRAREKQTYVARTWLTRRGGFPLGPTTLRVSDPLGLFHAERHFPAERTLVILPMVFPIQSFLSPAGLVSGGAVIRRKTTDITPHAAGVREYVTGDPMKRIHWPTSARRGSLMVKEFEQDPQAEVWLFLDAQDVVHYEVAHRVKEQAADVMMLKVDAFLFSKKPEFHLPPSSLEYAVTIAASAFTSAAMRSRSRGARNFFSSMSTPTSRSACSMSTPTRVDGATS